MRQPTDFDFVFALPDGGSHDAYALSDAVIAAGFEDAVIGTGRTGLLAVSIESEGGSASRPKQVSAQRILEVLPNGTKQLS
ncbi:hypothetical protein [Fodinicurvata sediminis]|uniref:hypothetical protein n=1 Tax=Fodinicurvata sediminis TaxID=1121832 RepID=UPI0003B72F79|nr:hypothetical protein [Fodinicurvata sediminis]